MPGHDEENKLLKAVERRFGVAGRYHGTKLWTEQNGKRVMTPMPVVMPAIGSTDRYGTGAASARIMTQSNSMTRPVVASRVTG